MDRLITLGKRQNLNARRELAKQLGAKAVKKVMDELTKNYTERLGGYTRVIRLGQRKSDGAEMAMVELMK